MLTLFRTLALTLSLSILSTAVVATTRDCADAVRLSALADMVARSPDVFLQVVEASTVGIVLTDPRLDGNPIVYANQAFLDMFRCDFASVQGLNCRFLQGKDTDAKTRAKIREALENRKPVEVEILNYDRKGRPIWVRLQISPIFDASRELIYFFGLQTDITLRKDEEHRSQEAALVRDQVIAFLAHEVRQGVVSIHEAVAILLASPTYSDLALPAKEGFGDVTLAADHLMKLLNDFLDIKLLESGTFQVNKELVRLRETVEETAQIVHSRVRDKGLHLDIQFDATLPFVITTDATRLRQLLLNLLSNAIRYTAEGTISIRVKMETQDRVSKVRFDIVDTGPGISPEVASRLFKPFTSTSQANVGSSRGTGLGLTISQRLAQTLGGELSLSYTKLGGGSTFSFTIDPSPFGTDPASAAFAPPALAHSGKLGGIRILVAEDVPVNQKILAHHLMKAGATFEFGQSLSETYALALGARNKGIPFDIFIFDNGLIGGTGIELISKLRAAGFKQPAIMHSAETAKAFQNDALASGFQAFLVKGARMELLVRAVEEALGSR